MRRYRYKSLTFMVVLFYIIPIYSLIARQPITTPESKLQIGWLHKAYSDSTVPDEVPMSNLKAGVAKVDLTPPIGTPLAGYSERTGPSTGIHDRLYAVTLVFDDGEKKAAIISLDYIGMYQSIGDAIRESVEEVAGIPGEYVIINASHTHGSPRLNLENNYTNEVIKKVAGAAKLAVDRLRPVSIGYGEGEIDFTISRRWVDEEGKCDFKLNREGVYDNRVKVLRIDDDNGVAPMAVVMHAVCHPNVFRGANTEISADFPGIAQSFVENVFGDKTTSMFLQGCTGDLRAKMYPVEGAYGGCRSGDDIDMTWCGWSLGAEAVKIATRLRVHEWAQERNTEFKIAAAHEMLKLDTDEERLKDRRSSRDKIVDGKLQVNARVLRIGDLWFVGLPGEPVVEYGLKIEKNLQGLGKVFVLGYTTGDNSYIPVSHMISEGGYEAAGRPYTETSEFEILQGVNRLIAQVINKSE